MKHVPERHQSVIPPPAFIATIAGIVALMAIVFVVVAWAEF